MEEALTINAENRDRKMTAYVNVIKQLDSNNNLIKDEIARLRSRKESNERVINKLKKVLISAMELFDLRNKNGNLYHKLELDTLTTRKSNVVEVKIEDFDSQTIETYSDFIDIIVKSKLTLEQLEAITGIVGRLDVEPTISKNKIKDAFESLTAIESIEEYEKEFAYLSELAEIKENTSLIIR